MTQLTLSDLTPDQLIQIGRVLKSTLTVTEPSDEIVPDDIPAPPAEQVSNTEKLSNAFEENPVDEGTPPSGHAVELGKSTTGQMIPWDARIHGKAKKKNADSSWRLIQGVDRTTLVPQVEAELVEATPDVPAPPLADGAMTFTELLPLIMKATAAGTLTQEKQQEVAAQLKLPQLGAIANRPELIPQAVQLLGL